jgi:hypothetical protein
MIAKADNTKAFSFDYCAASVIGGLLAISEMLSAIEFDYQFCCMTYEVSDVVCDRHLASEASPVQPVIAQLCPKQPLYVGRSLSKRARVAA